MSASNPPLAPSPPTSGRAAEPPLGLAREAALVATGGMLGAVLRAALATHPETTSVPFPLSTQVVNAVGAFGLGVLLAVLEADRPRPALRRFLAVGVLGSFTTFSTLIDDGRALAASASPGVALAFLALSLATGLLAYRAGHRLGSELGGLRSPRGRAST
ncbi:MAG: CrcB family protein [Myxococcota bacterium]